MTSTLESLDEIHKDLETAPTITPDDSHTMHSERAPVDTPHENELSATSSTLPRDTPEDTPEDPSISQTTTGTEPTGPGTSAPSDQSTDENQDQDEDEDSGTDEDSDEDSDEDFPRFEDTPRGRITKPVSGQKPPKPPK